MKNTLITVFVILTVATGALFVYYKSSLEKEATERAKIQLEQSKLKAASENEQERKLDTCLAMAEKEHWEYLKLNGTERADGSVWNDGYTIDRADKRLQEDKDNCFRRYQK